MEDIFWRKRDTGWNRTDDNNSTFSSHVDQHSLILGKAEVVDTTSFDVLTQFIFSAHA